jgi:O-succinylbenzoic acid--CoA ligase
MAIIDAADPAGVWDYDILHVLAGERVERLLGQGLRAGQLVAVPERPSLDLVLMQHALARSQAALLPVRDGLGPESMRALLQATGAEWIWRSEGPDGGRLVTTGCQTAGPSHGAPWPSPLALVVETSGSGGAPRAVMLTARNLLGSAALVNRHLALGAGNAWLCCLPLRHIGGLSIPYRCALGGAAVVLHQGFHAEAVADDLVRHGVTHLSLVPPMLARLLDLGRPPPPGLRVVLVGGQSLSVPLAGRALEAGWPLHLTYGMTETASQVACSDRLVVPPAVGAVGGPLPGLEIDCPACPGTPEVLKVRGPAVMAGYANPGRVPGDGLADGWLRTSDLACLDPDGVLHVLGRADEVLVTAGVKVYPAAVEAALTQARELGEVAVVGLPDAVWGQRLVALYTGGATPARLEAWCRARLSGPERPRAFIRCPELPTLQSGKLDRGRLRKLAAAALGVGSGGEESSANELK